MVTVHERAPENPRCVADLALQRRQKRGETGGRNGLRETECERGQSVGRYDSDAKSEECGVF